MKQPRWPTAGWVLRELCWYAGVIGLVAAAFVVVAALL